MHSSLPTKALLIKPVGAQCSMRCSYCFYAPPATLFHGPKVMTAKTRQTIQSAALQTLGEKVHLCWQGGEPTLAGLTFYKEAIEEQKCLTSGRGMCNSIQTNGLHIDAAWADFIHKAQILVGLSLDGPPQLHDLCRKDIHGNATGHIVHDAAQRLMDIGANVNVLCCISAQNVTHGVEIYEYFKAQGLNHMQFIPIVEGLAQKPGTPSPLSVEATAYGRFLCQLWDAWLADFSAEGPQTHVRFFESFCLAALGSAAVDCEMHHGCGLYAVVEHDGSIYPCDFFVEKCWRLGTVEDGLANVLTSAKARHFAELRPMMRPKGCLACPAAFFCHGGCLKFRRLGGSILPHNALCAAYTQFAQHALPHVPFVSAVMQWSQH